jgi:hypothetical protein
LLGSCKACICGDGCFEELYLIQHGGCCRWTFPEVCDSGKWRLF